MTTRQPTPDPAPLPDVTPSIPWEDRPAGSTGVIWRSSRNPIIGRDHLPRSNSIFNSAVVPFRDGFAGVFRVDDTTRTMNVHVGRSPDGVAWRISPRSRSSSRRRTTGSRRSRAGSSTPTTRA